MNKERKVEKKSGRNKGYLYKVIYSVKHINEAENEWGRVKALLELTLPFHYLL